MTSCDVYLKAIRHCLHMANIWSKLFENCLIKDEVTVCAKSYIASLNLQPLKQLVDGLANVTIKTIVLDLLTYTLPLRQLYKALCKQPWYQVGLLVMSIGTHCRSSHNAASGAKEPHSFQNRQVLMVSRS